MKVDDDMAKPKGKATETERIGVYLTKEQADALRELRAAGLNPAHFIREAVTRAIADAQAKLKGGRHGR
jgi:hypothetical protein